MDFLQQQVEQLAKQASEITVYDLKSAVGKAKNYFMNLTDMEIKVHEATNDEPWGASGTLMQEIAQGTFNYQHFNEIMPCIYQRFTEKEARQWRQIYKALVLLEYLIKNGSEKVVDDARSHLSYVKILRNFHYIDENGKDQGINVRNRAKEIAELLGDFERIRQERRRAKANRTKYTGVSSDSARGSGGPSFTTASGSRYGGFGSDSFGSSASRDYSGGHDAYQTSSNTGGDFEEYDAEDDVVPAPAAKSPAPPTPVAKPAAPVADLFSFDDDDDTPLSAVQAAAPKAAASQTAPVSLDDDFDDFQSAGTPAPAPAPAPVPSAQPTARTQPNAFDLLGAVQPAAAAKPSLAPAPAPMFASTPTLAPTSTLAPTKPIAATKAAAATPAPKAAPASDFSDLLDLLDTKPAAPAQKLSIAQLAEQTTKDKLYGSAKPPSANAPNWDSLI